MAVAPDERGVWTITVRNTATEPATYQLAATGDAAAWAWITPAELTVAPGEEATARFSLKLPPPPTPPAGRLTVSIEVRTAGSADVSVATTVVDVIAKVAVAASLGHSDGRGWAYPLSIRNQGNTDVRVALEAVGEGSVRASVEPASVVVAAGSTATASVTAKGRGSFQVHVRPEGAEELAVTGSVGAGSGGGSGGSGGAGRGGVLRWQVIVPVVAVVALVAAVLVSRGGGSPATNVESAPTTVSANCPVNGHLSADVNGIQRPGVLVPTRYAFLQAMPGGCLPERFNPCEPIHYVVNSRLAPAGALDDLTTAFAQLSAATGMTFVNDGPSDEPGAINRAPYQPQRYGDRWAPLLIVWDHGGLFRMGSDNPGGGRAIDVQGVYVSGILILNVDAVADPVTHTPIPFGFGSGATWGRVMIHELGHLVGLGHVNSPQEIMFNDLGPQTGQAQYHAGDLAGLQLVGVSAGCLQSPAHASPPTTR